ncbi:hypothetical protein C0991_003387 [Blastosporella zonata]|nr:hypothetical protein C0991_003387 [Blastosporella zonata]
MDLPHNIHELSHEADKAISDVNDFWRWLEDVLHLPNDNVDLVPLLQEYLGALESAGTWLSAWTVVNAHSNILNMIPLLACHKEYGSLCRELKPLSAVLEALGSRPTADQTIANITQILWPAVQPLQSESSLLPPLPLLFAGRGPFGSLGLVLQDCKDGCRVTLLFDFVAMLKQHAPKGFEPAVIAQTLNIVYPHQASMLSEASQVLLVRALDEILTWECKAGPGEPCPFLDTDC